MVYTPEAATVILNLVQDCLNANMSAPEKANRLWQTILLTRASLLTGGLRSLLGDTVQGGPFKGMKLTEDAVKSYQGPILLGSYEQELHPVFERVVQSQYDCILNIGCAVGYYAVGLAMQMPRTKIDAFDIAPEARHKCAELATLNGVSDRVEVSGHFHGEDFAKYAGRKTLVLMDIEGAEVQLLDPSQFPALRKMDMIVELHDVLGEPISKEICARFAHTHTLELIPNRNMPPIVEGILPPDVVVDAMDQLLMGWERRGGATPWGIFTAKA